LLANPRSEADKKTRKKRFFPTLRTQFGANSQLFFSKTDKNFQKYRFENKHVEKKVTEKRKKNLD
jgi:hypothetical protein